tara:strand:+ start:1180 stop:1680 length:501 start_codon:yes stop_codon:yes gene_type:complete
MFKEIKNPTPDWETWTNDVKIRCSLLDLPVPNRSQLRDQYNIEKKKEVYEGLGYQFKVVKNLSSMPYRDTPQIEKIIGDHMIWVEITRLDGNPVTSWDDKQMIKNFIGGEDLEGVELFPSTKRVHIHGESCHLWIMKRNDAFFPFGFPASVEQAKLKAQKDESSVH